METYPCVVNPVSFNHTLYQNARQRERLDEAELEWRSYLATLPQPLDGVARMLADGWTDREIACHYQKSQSFVTRSRERLRKLLQSAISI